MSGPPRRPPGETRSDVERLLAAGVSRAEIARTLGVTKQTVCFHLRMLGVVGEPVYARRYDWSAVRDFYDRGHSMAECLEAFGFGRSAWWDAVARGAITPRAHVEPIEDVLAVGRRRNRGHVKARLLGAGLKESRCEVCGIESWREAPRSLQLHHVNGDGMDNRLENLQLLCPNCHSQTETWGGRNRRAPSSSGLSQRRLCE